MPNENKREMTVRMYRPGLGDCFLLSFPGSDKSIFRILVDCGALSSTDADMKTVVKNIRDTTGRKIDVVIATHEHWDHISGFYQAKAEFDDIDFRIVWASWTEEPGNTAAQVLKDRFKKAKQSVAAAITKLPSDTAESKLGMYRKPISELFGFFGGLGSKADDRTASAWKSYLDRSKKKRYCRAKAAPIVLDEVEDVRIYVLGPPEDPDYIKRRLSKVETYDDGNHAFAAFSGFTAAFADPNDADDLELKERSHPFDPRFRILPANAKRNPFFVTHYGFSPKDRNRWRRIEYDWLAQAGELALHLDNYTNNTCFAFAVELGTEGKVLLFPGDAQVGNWLSWSDLSWEIKGKDNQKKTITIDDLLARTVLYKVGHHGSHNATLKAKGLEKMESEELTALIPVHRKTAEKQKWPFPFPALWERLKEKCRGRVILADSTSFREVNGDLEEKLTPKELKDFKSRTKHNKLFVEHTINY